MAGKNLSRRSSAAQYDFAHIPRLAMPRSKFRQPFRIPTTFDGNYMIPFYTDEVLPGDTFRVQMDSLIRMLTPITPVMDNIWLDVLFFFCPWRLTWDNFEDFISGNYTASNIPRLNFNGATPAANSVYDYLYGIDPVAIAANYPVSALYARADARIYNDWIRDENLITEVYCPTDNGPDTVASYTLRKAGKRHDYFSSALPWPQKGSPVTLPLTGNAPVIGNGKAMGFTDGSSQYGVGYEATAGNMALWTGNVGLNVATTGGSSGSEPLATAILGLSAVAANTGVIADLSGVSAVTINALRTAFQYQGILELDARGGTRFPEYLYSHFGVSVEDYRVQRPEFLDAQTIRLNVAPVAQTSETGSTPQGTLAAYAVGGHHKAGFVKSFVEHGCIIGYVRARSDMTYQNNLHRRYTRQTRFDFYDPQLAHLGEQAIRTDEIFFDGVVANGALAWAYQERWAEYRYHPSSVSGNMRSSHTNSFDIWLLTFDYSSAPALNQSFIEESAPFTRITATDYVGATFYGDFAFNNVVARVMPVHSVPSTLLSRI